MPNAFDVLKTMSEKSKDIRSFPLGNITHAQTGKDGFGRVTIAADNATILSLLSNTLVGMFIVADKAEFRATEAELAG